MPITTQYDVKTNYEVDARGARRKVQKLGKSAKEAAGWFERGKRRLKDALTVATGNLMASAVRSFKGLVGQGIRLADQMGRLKLETAGTLEAIATGGAKTEKVWKGAGDMLARFREKAQKTPKTVKSVVEGFRAVGPSLGGVQGLTPEKIAKFSASVPAVARKFTGGKVGQAGRSAGRIIRGQVQQDTPVFRQLRRPLFQKTGVSSTEEFKQLSRTERFKALFHEFESFFALFKKFSGTLAGVRQTLKGIQRMFLREIFEGVREELIKVPRQLVGFLRRNESRIRSFGRAIGTTLAEGIARARRAIEKLSGAAEEIVGGPAGLAGMLGAGKLLSGATGVGKNVLGKVGGAIGDVSKKAGKAAMFVISKIGLHSLISGVVGPLVGFLTTGPIGGAVATGGNALLTIIAGKKILSKVVAGLSKVFAVLSKGVAILTGIGTARVLRRGLGKMGDAISTVDKHLTTEFFSALRRLSGVFAELAGRVTSGILAALTGKTAKTVKGAADKFGRSFIRIVISLAEMFRNSANILDKVFKDIAGLGKQLEGLGEAMRIGGEYARPDWLAEAMEGITGVPSGAFGLTEQGIEHTGRAIKSTGSVLQTFSSGAMSGASFKSVDKQLKKSISSLEKLLEQGPGGDTNVTVNGGINVQVKSEADPDRIAFTVDQTLGKTVQDARASRSIEQNFATS